MRSWLSNWRNRRELDVEAELRAAKPEASARFVKSIAARVNPRPVKPVRTRTRLGLAAAVTVTMVAVVGATGGFSSAASSILGATHSVTHFSVPSAKPPAPPTTSPGAGARPTSAGAQYGAAPTISSFSPNPAYAGASINVSGTNFAGINQISEVDLGSEATSFVVNSGTSLTFTVPADGATGTITVTNSTGPATSGSSLVIVGAPTITHVNTGGEADTHEGGAGSDVQVQGTNFQTTTSVTLNGKSVTFDKNGAGTEIDFTIPTTVPSGNKGGIVVTNPAGTASDSSYNVLSNGPKLTAFSPALGRPHEHVILSGTNLQADTAPDTSVLFSDGSGGTVEGDSLAFASGGKIDVQVPTGAATGPLTVTNGIGTSTSTKSYTVVTDADVSSISPNFGKPNDMITINGSSFTPAVGHTTDTVQFAGSATALAVKPTGDNKLVVKVPSDATTGAITVDNGSGTAGSSDTWYRLAQQTATASPLDGASGTAIEVTGTHLIGTKTVAVNGKAVTAFTVPDDTHLDFVLPVGTPTTAPAAKLGIVITNAGPFTVQTPFTVDSTAPTIKTVSAHGASAALSAAAPGDTVDITGTFLNAALDVWFGYPDGSSSGHVSVGSGSSPTNAVTTVSVTVPADARTGVITVDNGDGAVSSAKSLTILGTPVVLGFSPGYGVSGTKLTIVGTNFAGATSVDFANPPAATVSAKPTLNKDGSLSVTVPKNVAPSTFIRVNVADPAGSTLQGDSGNNYFVIVNKPTIDAAPFSNAGGKAGDQVTVTGTNFQGITSVKFGKVSAGFQPVGTSTTQLLVTIPAGVNSSTITIANAAAPTGVTSKAVYSILRISSIAPSKGKVSSTVTIMGTGFNGGGSLASVKFGATSATVNATKSSDTKLTVTVPGSLSPGTYTVTVHGTFGDVTTSFQVTS